MYASYVVGRIRGPLIRSKGRFPVKLIKYQRPLFTTPVLYHPIFVTREFSLQAYNIFMKDTGLFCFFLHVSILFLLKPNDLFVSFSLF